MRVRLNNKVMEYIQELYNQNNNARARRAQTALSKGDYEIVFQSDGDKLVAEVRKRGSSTHYTVEIGPSYSSCTCKDAQMRHVVCKHQYMVAQHVKTLLDGNEVTVCQTTDKLTQELNKKKLLQPIRYRIDGRWHLYKPRKIKGKFTEDYDMKWLYAYWKVRKPVLLVGPAGSGKDSMVYAFASKMRLPVYSVDFREGLDEEILLGYLAPYGNRIRWVDGIITKAVRNGGILLLDEINAKTSMFSLHELLDFRNGLTIPETGEHISPHKNFWVVGTMNRGYYGTQSLNQAWKSRFAVELEVNYDTEIDRYILEKHKIPSIIADKFVHFIEKLRSLAREGILTDDPGYRLTESFALAYSLFESVEYGLEAVASKLEPPVDGAVIDAFRVVFGVNVDDWFGG